MIFNIDKSRDSSLGTKLEKTPTPQGLEQTANLRWGGLGNTLTAALRQQATAIDYATQVLTFSTDIRLFTNVGLMLGRHRRYKANLKSALA